MRKAILLAILVTVFCATSAMAAPKIGVVNVPRVLSESEPAKEVKNQLQNKIVGYKEQLQSMAKEIRELQITREKQKKMLKPEALESMDKKIREKAFRFNERQKEMDAKVKDFQTDLKAPLYTVLEKVITAYSKKNGIDIVLNSALGVLFAADAVNITDDIIKEFNTAWKNKK